MVSQRTEQFGDRVTFVGNLDKNDLSITLSDVQLEDEGIYNCYVRNPPDRIQGHGVIKFNVVTERKILSPPLKIQNCNCLYIPTFTFKIHSLISHNSIPATPKFLITAI